MSLSYDNTRKPGPKSRTPAIFIAILLLLAACGGTTATPPAESVPVGESSAPVGESNPANPAEFDNVTLRTSITVSGVNSPYYLGLVRGYFQEEGIILLIREGLGSALSSRLVGAGTDTFGIADAGTAAAFMDEGTPIKMVGIVLQKTQIAIISHADLGLTEPEDLEGRTLALSPQSAATVMWPAFVEATGIDGESITEASLNIPAAITAMRNRQVDANVGFQTSAAVPLEVEGLDLNLIKYADWGVNTFGSSIITTQALIDENPDLVRRFVRAAFRSLEAARDDPQAAVDAYVEFFPAANPEIIMGQLQVDLGNLHTDLTADQPIGETHPDDWEQTLDILLQSGLVTEERPVDYYYTDEFRP